MTEVHPAPTTSDDDGTVPTLPLTPPHLALHHTLFSSWYPLFRSHSPKATLIPVSTLQPDFLSWLEADSILIPRNSGHQPSSKPSPPHPNGRFSTVTSSDEQDALSSPSDDNDDDDAQGAPTFTALDAAIRTAIHRYDGAVFPKLNWSAPQDAAWILPGATLRCTTPEDIYLVLKSSDFISREVEQAAELATLQQQQLRQGEGDRPDSLDVATSRHTASDVAPAPAAPHLTLVLKKYFDMPKSHEFRCFVRRRTLICFSQRDVTFFEHLQPPSVQQTIQTRILDFFKDQLRDKMPIDDYIFDAYLTRDMARVFLVDVNPFLPRTDPILWVWEEVEDLAVQRVEKRQSEEREKVRIPISAFRRMDARDAPSQDTIPRETRPTSTSSSSSDNDLPPLRLITSHAQASQSFPTYSQNMVPKDVIDVSNGQGIAEFAREWNHRLATAHGHSASDDDAN